MQGCNFRCIPAYQIDMRIPSFLGAARALTLSLVLLGAPTIVAAQTDSTKAIAPRALRELLADASKRNVLPPSLISFRSNVETEISVLLRREEGNEAVAAVEQVAWSAPALQQLLLAQLSPQQLVSAAAVVQILALTLPVLLVTLQLLAASLH